MSEPATPKNFAIMRFKKLKTRFQIKGALLHAFREIETPNANPDIENIKFAGMPNTASEAMERHEKMMPKKFRKDAIRVVEFMVTASDLNKLSPEKQEEYFMKSMQYLANRMGGRQNIIHAEIHLDETQPHLTMLVTPKNEFGKLDGARMLGKTPAAVRDFQTEFYEKVAKQFGLARGLMNETPRKHEELRDYMKKVEQIENENLALKGKISELKERLERYEPEQPKMQNKSTMKMGI